MNLDVYKRQGVNRVKVLVLGGGTVGEAAARMAAGMGADAVSYTHLRYQSYRR